MSRLLYVPIIGAVVLMLGSYEQPSVEAGGDYRVPLVALPPLLCDSRGCSSSGGLFAAQLARATRGTLGGEHAARRRARTNFPPRL